MVLYSAILYLKNGTESVVSASSSKLTSSDKLSALPSTSTPPLGRMRTPTPAIRRGLDPTNSLPSLSSPSPPFGSTDLPPIGQHSVSEGSLGRDTTRQRVSFDSDRASLPSIQNIRQGERAGFKHFVFISYVRVQPFHRRFIVIATQPVSRHARTICLRLRIKALTLPAPARIPVPALLFVSSATAGIREKNPSCPSIHSEYGLGLSVYREAHRLGVI
jgi:hypothetical protein